MNKFDRIIEKKKQLDPNGISKVEIHHTGPDRCAVILNFGGPYTHTGVTLVGGMGLETAEELTEILQRQWVGECKMCNQSEIINDSGLCESCRSEV